MSNLLAFDIGTTYLKAAVFNKHGEPQAIARQPTHFQVPQPGRAEMSQAQWHHDICQLCQTLQATDRSAYEQIAAISFASQANTFLLLDEQGQPLTPLIGWTDQRANDQAAWLSQFDTIPQRYEHTGIPSIQSGFAIAKLRWLQAHQPQIWQHARRFCLISDELTHWLTGQHVTEAGIAALTGLLNIHDLQWWAPAIEAVGIEPAWLPQPVRAGTDLGPITREAADRLNLKPTARFVVGCLDQYAGAIAAGNLVNGRCSETTGTVLAVVNCSNDFDPQLIEHGVFQGPTYTQGLYYRMVFSDIAANMLEAYQREQAPSLSFAQLGLEAEVVLDSGSVDVQLDTKASQRLGKPVFTSQKISNGEATLAIMYAVANRLDEHLSSLFDHARPGSVVCLGGAARSQIWRKIKYLVTGIVMQSLPTDEPTCQGAAMCAHAALSNQSIRQVATAWRSDLPGIDNS